MPTGKKKTAQCYHQEYFLSETYTMNTIEEKKRKLENKNTKIIMNKL